MSEKIQFYEKTKGSLAENEDWYRLVVEEDGSRVVEHEWSHVNPYKEGEPDSGQNQIAVEEFLNGEYDRNAKSNLQKILAEQDEEPNA